MKYSHLIVLLLTLCFATSVTFAETAQYVSLTNGIPGVTEGAGLVSYLNALFTLLISFSVLIAIVKIAVSGIQYMMSEAGAGSKSKALGDIRASLIGLAIILSTVLILNVINPCIVNFNIFSPSTSECGGV